MQFKRLEQLFIWMPEDNRLLWLLGEVFNASAMEHQDVKRKNDAMFSAHAVFSRLNEFQAPRPMASRKRKSARINLKSGDKNCRARYRDNLPKNELPGRSN